MGIIREHGRFVNLRGGRGHEASWISGLETTLVFELSGGKRAAEPVVCVWLGAAGGKVGGGQEDQGPMES